MSPLHHHFELKGWGERLVVRVFWLVSLLFVILDCGDSGALEPASTRVV